MSPQVGRPKTENPKDITIRCRVTKEFNEELEQYCYENATTKSEVVIKGIRLVMKKEED